MDLVFAAYTYLTSQFQSGAVTCPTMPVTVDDDDGCVERGGCDKRDPPSTEMVVGTVITVVAAFVILVYVYVNYGGTRGPKVVKKGEVWKERQSNDSEERQNPMSFDKL